jgi:hypothetical protein
MRGSDVQAGIEIGGSAADLRSATKMNSKTRIRVDTIEPAQRALESLPEFRSEDLTKAQAVQMMIPQIRTAQSKGYSLEAISKVLSDRGIPIPIGSLRAYVSEANADTGRRRKKRKAKPATHASLETKKGPTAKTSQGDASAQPKAPAGKSGAASTPRKVDLDWDASSRSKKGTSAPGGFYVHPDEDL